MIQFYQQNSLKEYFKEVDTTLQTPYKQPEDSNTANNTPNTTPSTALYSTSLLLLFPSSIFKIGENVLKS